METVPGKGYRFIADVETVTASTDHVVRSPLAPPAPKAGNDLRTAPSVDGPATVTAEASAPPQEGLAYAALASPRGTSGHVRLAVGLVVVAAIFGVLARTRLGGGGSATGVAVAVLPFVNLGSDTEHDYVAAGLTDETSASLAQIDPEHLSVKGRTLPYKGTTKTAAEIGQELVVDYLVESSVQAEGGRLRVTVTLIRVRDQAHVWSQSYERQPSSLLGLQQELSAAIAEQIRFRLVARPRDGPRAPPDAERRGVRCVSAGPVSGSPAKRRRERARHRTLQARDCDRSELRTRLVRSCVRLRRSAINGDARPSEVAPLARAAALQAVRANPNLSEAQFSRGYELWLLDWDWPAAEAALRLAVALDPSNAVAYRTLGHALSQSGRRDDAEAAMRAARDLDPQDAMNRALSAQVAYQNRDFRGALGHARMAVSLDSSSWIGYVQLAQAYAGNGDNDLALEAVRDADRYLPGGNSKSLSLRGYLLARTGHADDAREVLRTLAARSREQYVPPSAMALVYAGLGEKDAMFEFLERRTLKVTFT